ncbi:jacalin-like lectin domain-containing protein [Phanerochaete sordida]|uniref:Jacalin-like lectin domain-containing protein n=1 Tax=Phanerochaete sordida TaxID=48140 RepID=A0A9P3GAV0_9APHY|nr:jacalin-like lectin domain-containing protein [Phanerochaete sordida]
MPSSVADETLEGALDILHKLAWIICCCNLFRPPRRPAPPSTNPSLFKEPYPEPKLPHIQETRRSPMAMQPKTVTVAAANYPGGIRCYTKLSGGVVREASLAVSDETLAKTMRDGNSNVASTIGWTSSTLPFKVHVKSSLCTVAWDAKNQSVFYQDLRGTLCEQRLVDGKTWTLSTNFKTPHVKLGTNIAAVASPKERKVILVYQHHKSEICVQTGSYDKWDDHITIDDTDAFACTGIGATSWDGLEHVRVYFQSKENSHVRELRKDRSGPWTLTAKPVIQSKHSIGDITAVGWGPAANPQVRLYLQDQDNNIVEYMNTKVPFVKGSFQQMAMPASDVIGFVRHVSAEPGFCINIMWVDEKQVLRQRIFDGHKWLEASELVYLNSPQSIPGKWDVPTKFNDQEVATTVKGGAPRKYIAEVRLHASDREIHSIRVVYTDGDATPVHGGEYKEKPRVFKLEPGEDITTVWYRTDNRGLGGLQFGTSKSRTSAWYGNDRGAFGCMSGDGHALIGFIGAINDRTDICGITPIWSEIETRLVHEEFADRLKKIKDGLPSIQSDCARIKTEAGALEAVWAAVEPTTKEAMAALADFTESVEMLYGFEHAKTSAKVRSTERRNRFVAEQVAVCDEDAKAVAIRFKTVAERVANLPSGAAKLRVEIDGLQNKANQAGLEAVIQEEIDNVHKRKQVIEKALASREKQVADAQSAAKSSAALYEEERPKVDHKQNGTSALGGTQNPFGSPNAPADEDEESDTLRDARRQKEQDESELGYHVAHRDFLKDAIARLDVEARELHGVTAQLRDALKAPAIKKALDEVAALEAQIVARETEIAELIAVLDELAPLCGQLAGKSDAKAFAKALLPVVGKVDAHAGLKGLCSKVEAHILLAAATQLAN